jgi:predicted transposase YdaD
VVAGAEEVEGLPRVDLLVTDVAEAGRLMRVTGNELAQRLRRDGAEKKGLLEIIVRT